MKIEIKPIVFGERSKDNLLARNGKAFIIGNCFFCDSPVWISEYAINPRKSNTKHIKAQEQIQRTKATRFLHKDCLIYVATSIIESLQENLKYRGQ